MPEKKKLGQEKNASTSRPNGGGIGGEYRGERSRVAIDDRHGRFTSGLHGDPFRDRRPTWAIHERPPIEILAKNVRANKQRAPSDGARCH